MKKKLLLTLGLTAGCINFVANSMIETSYPLLTQFLGDINHYKIHYHKEYSLVPIPPKKPGEEVKYRKDLWFHRGDLFSHTMWVTQHLANGACLANVFPDEYADYTAAEKKAAEINWCAGFTDRMHYLASIAALLHDLGKGGEPLYYLNYYKTQSDVPWAEYEIRPNGDIPYVEKPDHEQIGMHYILHDIKNPETYPAYHMVDGTPFNFKDLFDQLGLDLMEQKIVALLVGTHKIFAMLYNNSLELHKRAFKTRPPTLDEFNNELDAIIHEVGLEEDVYTKISLKETLLRMIMALNMADLLGVYFEVFRGTPPQVLQKFTFIPARRPFFITPDNGKTGPRNEKKNHFDYCKLSFCAAAYWRNILLEEILRYELTMLNSRQ